jgi:hypothetical protein
MQHTNHARQRSAERANVDIEILASKIKQRKCAFLRDTSVKDGVATLVEHESNFFVVIWNHKKNVTISVWTKEQYEKTSGRIDDAIVDRLKKRVGLGVAKKEQGYTIAELLKEKFVYEPTKAGS